VSLVDRAGAGVLGLFEFTGAVASFGARAVGEAVGRRTSRGKS